MKYYTIDYDDGTYKHGYFNSYCEALDYAESFNVGHEFFLAEYENEEDYFRSL